MDGSCFVEGPVGKKVSMLVSARRGFIGDVVRWYIDRHPDDFSFSIAPYYYDILARTDISLSKNNACFFTLLNSRDSLGLFMPSVQGGSSEITGSTNSLGIKIQFTTGLIGLDSRISRKLSNQLRYSYTIHDYDMSAFGYSSADERMYRHHFRDELTFSPSSALQISGGADVSLTEIDLALLIAGGKGVVKRDTTNNWLFGLVGAYAFLTIKPTDALQLQPGIRYDYFPELIHHGGIVPEFWRYRSFDNNQGPSGEPSARLSVRYRLNENHIVKAAAGNYSQTPQPVGQVIH